MTGEQLVSPGELTPDEQIKMAQRAEITEDRAHDVVLGVEQDKEYLAKGKAIEAAEKVGLSKEQVEKLFSDRAKYANERSNEIENAWNTADAMIAEALSGRDSFAEMHLHRTNRQALRNYQDLQDSLRNRLYAPETTTVAEGEEADPNGTPLIEGLSMKKSMVNTADSPDPIEKLEVMWEKK